jgi:AraC-like DNA-binding protein
MLHADRPVSRSVIESGGSPKGRDVQAMLGTARGVARVSLGAVRTYLRFCRVYQKAPRVSELARQLGGSRGTLIRAFKEQLGTTPARCLRQDQIARAKDFLRRGWSIERVAREACYGTRRAFFRSFRAETGMTPEAYRIEQNVTRQPRGDFHP